MAENEKRRGPLLVELDRTAPTERPVMIETPPGSDDRDRRASRTPGPDDAPSPADAAPIDDGGAPGAPSPRAMRLAARVLGSGPSRLTRFFINTGVALFTFLLSVAALNYLTNLLRTYPLLGWIGIGLMALFCIAALGMAWREYRAWARFAAIDGISAVAALAANLRMIRRMAEIYGGRAGAVGGWRLARTVMAHLVATGAVAAGDDLIHTVAGGGILARVSKRFGEGVVNGALTARVGIAAMEVCRPLPFVQQPRPSVGNLIARGLKGLFGEDEAK